MCVSVNWSMGCELPLVERVWGGKIDPKFDCHYFDPTCAAGGSLKHWTS